MSCPACGAASQDPTGYCAACRLRLQDSIETGYQSSQDVAATIRVLSAAHANEETREPVGRSQFFDDLQTLPSGAQVGGPGRSESAQAARSGAGSGPLQVGQTFGARYHILKILGVGGMGAVYQAWDAELGEAVAIKRSEERRVGKECRL